MIGNQWKTTGGSLGFLNSSWFRTFITTDKKIKEATAVATRTGVEVEAAKAANGPAISAENPMIARGRVRNTGERIVVVKEGGRVGEYGVWFVVDATTGLCEIVAGACKPG